MGKFAQMAERYVMKMRWAITAKEERYLTADPEDFDTDEINALIRWCREQIEDLNKSCDEVNELLDNYNRTQAGMLVDDQEYNSTLEDFRALDWMKNEFRKLYKRLHRLIDTFIDYSDEE